MRIHSETIVERRTLATDPATDGVEQMLIPGLGCCSCCSCGATTK